MKRGKAAPKSADDLAKQAERLEARLRQIRLAQKAAEKAQASAGAPILSAAVHKAKIAIMTPAQASEIASLIASLGAAETLKRLVN